MKRRFFVKAALKVILSTSLATLAAIFVYMYPSRLKEKKLSFHYLMDDYDMPRRGVKKVELKYGADEKTISLYVSAHEKGVSVFSSVCTHLGCLVVWDGNRKEFLCPCHGGRYSRTGKVIDGPPPKGLSELPIMLKEGKVYVGVRL